MGNIHLFNKDVLEFLESEKLNELLKGKKAVIVTDPPFNIGLNYRSYKDNLKEQEYYEWLKKVFTCKELPFVVVHYPENLYKLSYYVNMFPQRVVTWCYNSNTSKQHRDIAFFGIKPNMAQVKQPYKNPNDKRIKERIEKGLTGAKIYDWWNINQVKNVSKKGITHPCIMPVEVMKNVVGILPKDYVIIDPFMGSGTTGIACLEIGREFIGNEIDKVYFEEAINRFGLERIETYEN